MIRSILVFRLLSESGAHLPKKTFEMKLYNEVQHAFFNEMMPSYNKSAEDTWERAVSFFSKYLVK